jgi:ketosteroid isomerase-like protein
METTTAIKTNLQVIQQAFDDFAQGNISGIIDVCTDDVVWESYENPDVPYAGAFHGKEGVKDFFSKLAGAVNYSFFEPKEFIGEGDSIIALGHQTGTVKATGKTFDHDWSFSFKMQNGKLKHFFSFVDSRDQSQAFK